MCHIILLLPIIALLLFWVLPLVYALPIYLVILVMSGLVYFAMMKAMNRPVTTGREGLIGETAEVIEMTEHNGRVRVHGEIWGAVSDDILSTGDKARIIGMEDMTLRIRKELPSSKQPDKSGSESSQHN